MNISINYDANHVGIAVEDALLNRGWTQRGFAAVSLCSSCVFNINKTNASPPPSYVVRGEEQMFQKNNNKKLSPLPYYSEKGGCFYKTVYKLLEFGHVKKKNKKRLGLRVRPRGLCVGKSDFVF